MPMLTKSHYDILGVAPTADHSAIAEAYRKKAKACQTTNKIHRDKENATNDFQKIGAAFAVLKDATQRSLYDTTLRKQQRRSFGGGLSSRSNTNNKGSLINTPQKRWATQHPRTEPKKAQWAAVPRRELLRPTENTPSKKVGFQEVKQQEASTDQLLERKENNCGKAADLVAPEQGARDGSSMEDCLKDLMEELDRQHENQQQEAMANVVKAAGKLERESEQADTQSKSSLAKTPSMIWRRSISKPEELQGTEATSTPRQSAFAKVLVFWLPQQKKEPTPMFWLRPKQHNQGRDEAAPEQHESNFAKVPVFWLPQQTQLQLDADKQNKAATEIQKIWRGASAYKTARAAIAARSATKQVIAAMVGNEHREATTIQIACRAYIAAYEANKAAQSDAKELCRENEAKLLAQSEAREWFFRREIAATSIQEAWRGYIAAVEANEATLLAQSEAREWFDTVDDKELRRESAATSIQKTWRRASSRCHFKSVLMGRIAERQLQQLRERRNHAASNVQKIWRGLSARSDFRVRLDCIRLLQSVVRQWHAVRQVQQLKATRRQEAGTAIQSLIRQWLAMRQVTQLNATRRQKAATAIQSVIRQWIATRQVEQLRTTRRQKAGSAIQKTWRRHIIQSGYTNSRRQIIIVQSLARQRLATQKVNQLLQELHHNMGAVVIQKHFRAHIYSSRYSKELAAIVTSQSVARVWLAKKAVQQVQATKEAEMNSVDASEMDDESEMILNEEYSSEEICAEDSVEEEDSDEEEDDVEEVVKKVVRKEVFFEEEDSDEEEDDVEEVAKKVVRQEVKTAKEEETTCLDAPLEKDESTEEYSSSEDTSDDVVESDDSDFVESEGSDEDEDEDEEEVEEVTKQEVHEAQAAKEALEKGVNKEASSSSSKEPEMADLTDDEACQQPDDDSAVDTSTQRAQELKSDLEALYQKHKGRSIDIEGKQCLDQITGPVLKDFLRSLKGQEESDYFRRCGLKKEMLLLSLRVGELRQNVATILGLQE